jgi:hypothetical protein
MKPAVLALAGGTALVAAVAGWELRSQWLASTLKILPTSDQSQITEDESLALRIPETCGGYRRASSTEGGRQQIYVKGTDTISLFIPGSTAADIAAAPGWATQAGSDGSQFYTLIGQNDHCAVAFTYGNQPIVLASRIKSGRLIAFAEQLKAAMRDRK